MKNKNFKQCKNIHPAQLDESLLSFSSRDYNNVIRFLSKAVREFDIKTGKQVVVYVDFPYVALKVNCENVEGGYRIRNLGSSYAFGGKVLIDMLKEKYDIAGNKYILKKEEVKGIGEVLLINLDEPYEETNKTTEVGK